jgi:N-glycosylase/DNA lyase
MLNTVQMLKVTDFDLASTIESGQIFRWEAKDGGYAIRHANEQFFVKQNGDALEFSGTTPEFLMRFFALDVDYATIKKSLGRDKTLAKAIKTYPGLRVIRQDPWECTVAFLCSSFSNIKKIQLNLRKLVETFSDGKKFPLPTQLNDHDKIRDCSTGYRSKYIYETSRKVSPLYFKHLQHVPYAKAKESLMQLPGVGAKVADCILLFALGHGEAFPVDVWMQRVMEESYFNGKKTKEKEIRAVAASKWGPLAGYAQQYLYHWRRLQ